MFCLNSENCSRSIFVLSRNYFSFDHTQLNISSADSLISCSGEYRKRRSNETHVKCLACHLVTMCFKSMRFQWNLTLFETLAHPLCSPLFVIVCIWEEKMCWCAIAAQRDIILSLVWSILSVLCWMRSFYTHPQSNPINDADGCVFARTWHAFIFIVFVIRVARGGFGKW